MSQKAESSLEEQDAAAADVRPIMDDGRYWWKLQNEELNSAYSIKGR
jgi:hypothetical protein